MKWSAHVESWPAIRPFRITGKVWNTFDSIVVELAEGGAYGRGEALGVYYLDETAETMLAQVETLSDALARGIDRAALQSLLPPGGARNAIIISYWKDFFYNPTDPATYRFLMDYVTWITYAFPMFLLRLPIVTAILIFTFKPEVTDMSRAIARLRTQVSMQGPMRASEWLTIMIFALTIVGWVTLSNSLGLGVIAIGGASLFLILGLVRWEDINSGVNWGVVLLYAAAISLGVEMKETGAAEWVARSVFEGMTQIGATGTFGFNAVISLLTIGVSNTMTAGAAVAVLAPIVLKTAVTAHQDPISAGFITAISSAFGYLTPAAQPAFTIIYASGFLRGSDFFKVGIRMMVLSFIVLMAISVLYWPMLAP